MSELFIELFCEELPPSFVRPALDSLTKGLLGLLEGVEHGAVRTWATPRRLAVSIADVAAGRPATEALVTGPPADRAWVDGAWTKAAIGFARGKGVDESALEIVDTKRGKVVAARVREGGERAYDLIAAGLEGVVLGIPFRKSMEWGSGGLRFGRPLHRVSALLGGEVVNTTVGGIRTGASTEGHRLASDREFAFTGSADWADGLRARQVEPDLEDRAEIIRGILDEVESELGCDRIEDPELFEEVLHLVEWPVKVIGTIDQDLLHLPPRLLVEAMKKHQRYFPVFEGGRLTNRFVVIANNPWADLELVAEGNARVLRPRFYDARFFYEEDKKTSLEAHAAKLVKMRWIRGLGTVADKGQRLGRLCEALAASFGADPESARRAGELAKGDLFTLMVGEFPELQGHMGKLYAEAGGEREAVSIAIEEHYLPRFADDDVASTPEGITAAVADRLDTLVGCFGIGLKPKGGDPQGLRRAALGVVRTLIANGFDLDLGSLFHIALDVFHQTAGGAEGFEAWTKVHGDGQTTAQDADELVAELVEFTLARFSASEVADGASADVVDAVLAVSKPHPLDLHNKVSAIKGVAGTDEFGAIMETFKRVLNITKDEQVGAPAPSKLREPAEKALGDAIARVSSSAALTAVEPDYPAVLSEVLSLREPVDQFFVDLMVNHDDPEIRAVRLGLLSQVSGLFRRVADFSRISTR
ncbi:MAG: glycine--tRNA ligase subunit beta [Deltaproteobacteria bacterium]|nr:MAG: glycine--tRNA ligase subunit beta [Deltaproteobacteria bacterium]